MDDPIAMDITDFCKTYGVGRSFTFEELRLGRLKAKKAGRKTIITKTDADEWLASRPDWKPRNQSVTNPCVGSPYPPARTA